MQPSTTINLFTVQQPGTEQVPPPQVTYTQSDGVHRRVTEQEVAALPEETIIDNSESKNDFKSVYIN